MASPVYGAIPTRDLGAARAAYDSGSAEASARAHAAVAASRLRATTGQGASGVRGPPATSSARLTSASSESSGGFVPTDAGHAGSHGGGLPSRGYSSTGGSGGVAATAASLETAEVGLSAASGVRRRGVGAADASSGPSLAPISVAHAAHTQHSDDDDDEAAAVRLRNSMRDEALSQIRARNSSGGAGLLGLPSPLAGAGASAAPRHGSGTTTPGAGRSSSGASESGATGGADDNGAGEPDGGDVGAGLPGTPIACSEPGHSAADTAFAKATLAASVDGLGTAAAAIAAGGSGEQERGLCGRHRRAKPQCSMPH